MEGVGITTLTHNKILFDTINQLNEKFEGNIIFVGGISEIILGIKENTNDIDIVFYDNKYISDINPIIKKELPTMPFTGYKFHFNGYYIDGYLSTIEYPYSEVDGIKYQNLNQLIEMKEMTLRENWLTKYELIEKVKNSLIKLKKLKYD